MKRLVRIKKHDVIYDVSERMSCRGGGAARLYGAPTSKDSMGRRTWNSEYYAAVERGEIRPGPAGPGAGETKPAPEAPAPVGKMCGRRGVDFSGMHGRTETVDLGGKDGGLCCVSCNVSFKDSQSYLDHLNSARHLRMKGIVGLAEKSTAKDVRERLALLKRKRDTPAAEPSKKAPGAEPPLKKAGGAPAAAEDGLPSSFGSSKKK